MRGHLILKKKYSTVRAVLAYISYIQNKIPKIICTRGYGEPTCSYMAFWMNSLTLNLLGAPAIRLFHVQQDVLFGPCLTQTGQSRNLFEPSNLHLRTFFVPISYPFHHHHIIFLLFVFFFLFFYSSGCGVAW